VDEECQLLRAAVHPTVLSTEPKEAVERRYACVRGIRVIAVVLRADRGGGSTAAGGTVVA
jgi:hypothetical protein